MSKHICWRGFKRMCDRCSHSLFHAPDLNNSPCPDNPCTQDHLHGTAEPGNFRLRPSVCFCSITAPSAQGTPLTRLYSAEEESPFSLHILSPCFPSSNMFRYMWGLLLGEHCLDCQGTYSRYSSHPSCLPLGPPHPASMSRNHSVLSWSLSCVEALTVEASSVLTAAASGLKLWHLLTPFLPSPACPPPPSVYPHSETQHTPMGRQSRGQIAVLLQQHVTWCFHNNGGGQRITEAGVDTCFTKQVQ